MASRFLAAGALSVLLLTTPSVRAADVPSKTIATIDACSLLKAAEIQATVGAPVDPGVRRDAGMESNGA